MRKTNIKKRLCRALCRFAGIGAVCLLPATLMAQLRWQAPQNMARWGIPAGQYSGLTHLYDSHYAAVDDHRAGFQLWEIRQDSVTGVVTHVARRHVILWEDPQHADLEAVAWHPGQKRLYVASEAFQTITPYDLEGLPAGNPLPVPAAWNPEAIYGNYGFESLTYDKGRDCFWTTTENVLRRDGCPSDWQHPQPACLRFLALSASGDSCQEYRYVTDAPQSRKGGRAYAFGVSELLSLSDTALLVLEREAYIASRYLKSWVHHRLYVTNPTRPSGDRLLVKKLLTESRTRLDLFHYRFANYEGMCRGIRLADGRQTILFLCDSQGKAGNRLFRLKDYIRVLILPHGY